MSYRLKNSDFKPFLGILEGKVSDSGVYVGKGIGCVFWIFLSGESVPRVWVGEVSRNYLLTD